MTKPTAVLATFVNAKPVPTRSTLQLIFEVAIEQADEAMAALGGYPLPQESRWVGIALAPKERKEVEARSSAEEQLPSKQEVAGSNPAAPTKERKAFSEYKPSQRAGMLCSDDNFMLFLSEQLGHEYNAFTMEGAAERVREICDVVSRSQFDTDPKAEQRWNFLESAYEGWKTDHRYKDVRRG